MSNFSAVNERASKFVSSSLENGREFLCDNLCDSPTTLDVVQSGDPDSVWMWNMMYVLAGIVITVGTITFMQKRKMI